MTKCGKVRGEPQPDNKQGAGGAPARVNGRATRIYRYFVAPCPLHYDPLCKRHHYYHGILRRSMLRRYVRATCSDPDKPMTGSRCASSATRYAVRTMVSQMLPSCVLRRSERRHGGTQDRLPADRWGCDQPAK